MSCVGVRGDCSVVRGWKVCICVRIYICVHVCTCMCDWCRMLLWQENRSRDLKSTCLGSFWDQRFELTVLFGFGWVFQRAAQDKRLESLLLLHIFHFKIPTFHGHQLWQIADRIVFHTRRRLTTQQTLWAFFADSQGQEIHNVVLKLKICFRIWPDLVVIYGTLFLILQK